MCKPPTFLREQKKTKIISHFITYLEEEYNTHTKENNMMNITLNTVLKINTIVGAAYASNVILMPAK